ncbi:helix-turn-helix domain-containing protein [Megamonas hypermegale]|uniref:helix-turn-helix domain-containing protein n=1 Tax=Megamonas hypermegale TaxID=158847 RepID=UPI0026EF546B|nr:helix-turn-helix transcriptional regulator [Megamonas hypermegale]
MPFIKAVDCRILELCERNHLSINGLANRAGMPPSTVASILSEKSRNPGELTIFKICIGFGISMKQFYSSKLFDVENIDLEKVHNA